MHKIIAQKDDAGHWTAWASGHPEIGYGGDTAAVAVTVDFAGIDQRIIALGVPAGDISDLTAGRAGTVFCL